MSKRPSPEARELARLEAQLGAKSFHQFVKMAWPNVRSVAAYTYLDNWHIGLLCRELEACYRGERKELLINIPPSMMKSLLVSILFPAWVWIHDPSRRFISASYDVNLAISHASQTQELVESTWFQSRWPTVALDKGQATGFYETKAGGFRFATSVKGAMTGRHCHYLIVDDPIKPGDAARDGKELEVVREWWRGTTTTRFVAPTEARKIVVMQRLHPEDLSATVLENEAVRHVKLPMEYVASGAFEGDPRTRDGELLWTTRFPESVISAMQVAMGPQNWASQMQQDPQLAGGEIFQRDWFPRYRVDPQATYDYQFQSWDCTFKDTKNSDYVAGGVFGVRGPNIYLLKIINQRLSFTKTCEAIEVVSSEFPKARAKYIEDKANGAAVMDTLKTKIPGLVAVEPEGGKVARANAVTGLCQARNVHVPEGPEGDLLIQQLCAFPRGKHDDLVDMLSQGLVRVNGKDKSFSEAMRKLRQG